MFKMLNQISVATAIDLKALIPLNNSLWFGISMPAFVALHIFEHMLPVGPTRNALKAVKVVAGAWIESELFDYASSQA